MARSPRHGGKAGKHGGTLARAAAAGVAAIVACGWPAACSFERSERRLEPAYLCPKLADRCMRCRAAVPGFAEGDCRGDILERCKAKAARRPSWLGDLAAALDKDSCLEFEQAL